MYYIKELFSKLVTYQKLVPSISNTIAVIGKSMYYIQNLDKPENASSTAIFVQSMQKQ